MKTLEGKLPYPLELPGGEMAEDYVIRPLTVKERKELNQKYRNNFDSWLTEALRRRLLRLGSLDGPIDPEIIESMPTTIFDHLVEAMFALDAGYESVEAFRGSEEYRRMAGA